MKQYLNESHLTNNDEDFTRVAVFLNLKKYVQVVSASWRSLSVSREVTVHSIF
jgi:hypothetical protein